MWKMLLLVVLAALTTKPALAAPDPRSDDAVAVFNDLCVSLFTDERKSQIDPARFSFTKISEKNALEIEPNAKGQLWDVSGAKSDVHMLVHYEPTGMCVVEVAAADEASIRTNFENLVQQVSNTLKVTAQREPDKRNQVEGKDATTSLWRMKNPKGDIMLAITTYPDPKFMIQHLMTVSHVK